MEDKRLETLRNLGNMLAIDINVYHQDLENEGRGTWYWVIGDLNSNKETLYPGGFTYREYAIKSLVRTIEAAIVKSLPEIEETDEEKRDRS